MKQLFKKTIKQGLNKLCLIMQVLEITEDTKVEIKYGQANVLSDLQKHQMRSMILILPRVYQTYHQKIQKHQVNCLIQMHNKQLIILQIKLLIFAKQKWVHNKKLHLIEQSYKKCTQKDLNSFELSGQIIWINLLIQKTLKNFHKQIKSEPNFNLVESKY